MPKYAISGSRYAATTFAEVASMMKPLIGITMNLEEQQTRSLNILCQDYGKAVAASGGIPVPILGLEEMIPEYVKRCDGFLFTGGDDIAPRYYRERPVKDAPLSIAPKRRTDFEIALLNAVVRTDTPILAICHGAQLVNVALGGTLYQDIALQLPDPLAHGAAQSDKKVFHPVDILEGTRLSHIVGKQRIRVRSAHHQSVKNPGNGLHLAAVSHDGVIEALESRDRDFLIALQWHPEKMLNDVFTKKIFSAFVHAAKR